MFLTVNTLAQGYIGISLGLGRHYYSYLNDSDPGNKKKTTHYSGLPFP
jgi:hypothetical protein